MNLKLTSLAACLGLVLVSAGACWAADREGAKAPAGWFQWRGPNRDGKSPDKGLLKSWPAGGPKLLWKVTGIGQGFSNVSFGGGLWQAVCCLERRFNSMSEITVRSREMEE